jgi:aldehyde dehydrogenase (NAD+)
MEPTVEAVPDEAPPPKDDTSDSVKRRVQSLRKAFRSGTTRSIRWRREQLKALKRLVIEKEDVFVEALAQDMGKPAFEAWIGELALLGGEVDHTLKRLGNWTKAKKVRTGLVHQPAKAYTRREPLGTVLIIGPWNYPVQLILAPLIGAIAAGNTVVLKPSELAPHTSAALAEWVPRYLDPDCIAIIEGGIEASQALLRERFDHIFYTGGGTVGRIVMEAAAQHLTPVTLELGGKSPCIVDEHVDIETAARRITWGKFFNAGQTCVAPDYILVHQSVAGPFVEAVKRNIRAFYGEVPGEPRPDTHYQRPTF